MRLYIDVESVDLLRGELKCYTPSRRYSICKSAYNVAKSLNLINIMS
jgi:hypothetical protein